MITNTYIANNYRAEVFDNNTVKIYVNDQLIDNPGPWGTHDGACQWAELIVNKYAVDGHQPVPQPNLN